MMILDVEVWLIKDKTHNVTPPFLKKEKKTKIVEQEIETRNKIITVSTQF